MTSRTSAATLLRRQRMAATKTRNRSAITVLSSSPCQLRALSTLPPPRWCIEKPHETLSPAMPLGRTFSTALADEEDEEEHYEEAKGVTETVPATKSMSAVDESTSPLEAHLVKLVLSGAVRHDEYQLKTARELDRILRDLNDTPDASAASAPSPGFFSVFASAFSKTVPSFLSSNIQGAYLYGGVGCGKTFLMTLFHDHVPDGLKKRKVHFHKFMLDVHQHLHEARQVRQTKKAGNHPVPLDRSKPRQDESEDLLMNVVDRLAPEGSSSEPWVLCLDEFQVTDVADAMLLRQLFEGLWKRNCVLVATSNRPPDELYKDGLQRDRFLPFLDALADNCSVINMTGSPTDYRLVALAKDDGSIRAVFTKSQSAELNSVFHKLVDGNPVRPTLLKHRNGSRTLRIPQACATKRVAKFAFADLCQAALGAADYLFVAQNFSTVVVDTIPKLQVHIHLNYVRRFITFIDAMYDSNVTVLLQTTAVDQDGDLASLLDAMLDATTTTAHDEVFALERCKSRLMEMSSASYLQKQWKDGQTTIEVDALLNLQPSPSDHQGRTGL